MIPVQLFAVGLWMAAFGVAIARDDQSLALGLTTGWLIGGLFWAGGLRGMLTIGSDDD